MIAIEATLPHETPEAALAASTIAPATDTIISIRYEAARDEGKGIVKRAVRDQLRLGELADKVETRYGDRTLATLAGDIGIAPCTLERHRSVYRAWREKPAPGPVSYAVLRALQDHPDRYNIVEENPKLTQAEARKLMRPYRTDGQDKCGAKLEDEGEANQWTKHNAKFFRNLVAFAHDATNAAQAILDSPPEKQREFLQVVEPLMVGKLKLAGITFIEFADLLNKLLDEATTTTTKEEHPADEAEHEAVLQAAE